MILCLHDDDHFIEKTCHYLTKRGCQAISISLRELVEKVAIEQIKNSTKRRCIWHFGSTIIDFSKPLVIYQQVACLNIDHFDRFDPQDRHYLLSTWRAYLLACLSKFDYCLNPVNEQNMNHPMPSVTKLERLDLLINQKKPSTFSRSPFMRKLKSSPQQLVVTKVGKKFYTSSIQENDIIKAKLTRHEYEYIDAFMKTYYLEVGQIIFQRHERKIKLLTITPYPNWILNTQNPEEMMKQMSKLLMHKNNKAHADDNKRKTFIDRKHRPFF